MVRVLTEPLLFFTFPFLVYAVVLVAQLVNPFGVDHWTRRVVVPLTLAGLILAVGSIVLVGLLAPRYEGGYVPAHEENGHIVPGQMR